jgi:feruloyl-CoA synthase
MGSLVHDVVVAGHDRDDVRMLVFPNVATCRTIAQLPPHTGAREVLSHRGVKERFASALVRFGSGRHASSTSVGCVILLEVPPSIDAGEITDKGSLNQKAVLTNRRMLVDQLYGAPGSAVLIDVSQRSRAQ